ncbi:hypothetical protein DFQ13_10752 [Actinokineospora spheciospongiae]|nr:hypothetical protein DFQ13_10752 [Actinokineospora spheciospongiae]
MNKFKVTKQFFRFLEDDEIEFSLLTKLTSGMSRN